MALLSLWVSRGRSRNLQGGAGDGHPLIAHLLNPFMARMVTLVKTLSGLRH